MITPEYRANRPRFPAVEVARYQGQWVAFSADGCRVVTSGANVAQLEDRLAALGEEGQRVVLEWVALEWEGGRTPVALGCGMRALRVDRPTAARCNAMRAPPEMQPKPAPATSPA